jgi:probable HAF family extracellular repeat protein
LLFRTVDMTRLRLLLAFAALAASGGGCTPDGLRGPVDAGYEHASPDGSPFGPDCVGCSATPSGHPSWKPTRVVLFSGNIGSDGEHTTTLLQSVLGPRHQYLGKVFISAEPHAPPYDDELDELLDARGITPSQRFDDVQFTAPQGVLMAISVVPTGEVEGASTDFWSGPVIDSSAFPLEVDWGLCSGPTCSVERDDLNLSFSQTDPPSAVRGASHLLLGFAESSRLSAELRPGAAVLPPDGSYLYRVTISDQRQGEWNLLVPFKVGTGISVDVPIATPTDGGVADLGAPVADAGVPDAVADACAPDGGGDADGGAAITLDAGNVTIKPVSGIGPVGMDATATVIVGELNFQAMRWTEATGATPLPVAITDQQSRANAVSADGRVAVGLASTSAGTEAVRWLDGNIERLGFALPGDNASVALAVSADGTVVAGSSRTDLPAPSYRARAFRWRDGVMTAIEPFPGDAVTGVALLSADGSTIVGSSSPNSGGTYRLFVWTDVNGLEEVAPVGGASAMLPRGISADGSVVVGETRPGGTASPQAFRWTHATGAVLLTPPDRQAAVAGVSADGTVVGGVFRTTMTSSSGAFFWTASGLEHVDFAPANSNGPVIDRDGRTIASFVYNGGNQFSVSVFIRGDAGIERLDLPVTVLPNAPFLGLAVDGRTALVGAAGGPVLVNWSAP